MSVTELAPRDHNKPPTIKAEIEERHDALFKRLAEIEKLLPTIPTKITDEETSGKVGDFLKMVRALIAQFESTRKVENEDARRRLSEINTAFTKPTDALKTKVQPIKEAQESYLQEKADREKADLEVKAAKLREEQLVREKAAAEAESRRIAAEKAEADARAREADALRAAEAEKARQREAEERAEAARTAEREANERRLRAEVEEREQAASALREMADLSDQAAELITMGLRTPDQTATLDGLLRPGCQFEVLNARVLRASELLDQRTLDRRIRVAAKFMGFQEARLQTLEAEAEEAAARRRIADQERQARERAEQEERDRLRLIDEAAAEQARAEREKAEAEAAEAKERAKQFKEDARDARSDQTDARREGRTAGRQERTNFDQAARLDKKAEKTEAKAEGPEGDLIRTRGDLGSVSTLGRRWVVTVKSIAELDLEKLRHLIHPDALQAAAQRYMDAGGRELAGATIEQVTGLVTI